MSSLAPPGNYLRAVEVDSLFGEYDYRLRLDKEGYDPRVLVLYGQNGSGKTTVLKMIRSLLSTDNAGHRSWLAKLPFKRVSIELSNGLTVEAVRKDELTGAFRWVLKKQRIDIQSMNIRPRNGRVSIEDWDEAQKEKYESFKAELIAAIPHVIYLDDQRTFFEQGRPSGELRYVTQRYPDGRVRRVSIQDAAEENDPVNAALKELAHSARREALLLSNRGSQGAQSIYTSLIDRLASNMRRHDSIAGNSKNELIAKLDKEQSRSQVLSKYGLVAAVDHTEMLRAIERVGDDGLPVLSNVLEPYVESLSARFDAVEFLHNSIDQWITDIDEFLRPKKARFRVGDEVQVFSKSDKPLSASVLSSGERHLLFLLTKAFLMRSTGGLLLIDEPELSLNITWQRRLIRSLLASFGGAPGQLIVASHSLEIAAQFDSNVMEMVE